MGICHGRLWPLCLDFSLSLADAADGHHFFFSINLLLGTSAKSGYFPPCYMPCPCELPCHMHHTLFPYPGCSWSLGATFVCEGGEWPLLSALPKPCQPLSQELLAVSSCLDAGKPSHTWSLALLQNTFSLEPITSAIRDNIFSISRGGSNKILGSIPRVVKYCNSLPSKIVIAPCLSVAEAFE